MLSLFGIPRLWRDVKQAVNHPGFLFGADPFIDMRLKSLEARCRKVHNEIFVHLDAYQAHCLRLVAHTHILPDTEVAMRRSFYQAANSGFMIIKHLLATVCDEERHELMVGAHAMARSILALHKQQSKGMSWISSQCEVDTARYVLQHEVQWEEDLRGVTPQVGKLASRTRFNTWSSGL